MNWKRITYFQYASARGYRFPAFYSAFSREFRAGDIGNIASKMLGRLLSHCQAHVPFYAGVMKASGRPNPVGSGPDHRLPSLPILTKDKILAHFDELRSSDLPSRQWTYNTSGGSTGEPVRLIQDRDYADRSKAITFLYYSLLGYETGQPMIRLWGSERDIEGHTKTFKSKFFNWLTNTSYLNAFKMTPERMREFIQTLNTIRPKLIVAYAQAMYELAVFAESEDIKVEPQRAVVTSAGTLYPFMRAKIATVFGCQVYNLYGSREVSDMGCEIPGSEGLWVAPWGNYLEVVDDSGQPVPPGTEGNILVTCLTNYAMPLIRYQIGDRGALLPASRSGFNPPGQVLKCVTGRNVDMFRTRNGTLVDGEYFTHLLYFRPWVRKFQVVQKNRNHVLFKILKPAQPPPKTELTEIGERTRLAMGQDCSVNFEFVEELPPHPSGKYRYTISEVTACSAPSTSLDCKL
ncbi:MAG: phenylacetate--CoA ligase family protein [Verrucomicrobiales bacterium]|nr:phenylacetate--CoA ligase family protein [Verrucomicrobiales bacterium]